MWNSRFLRGAAAVALLLAGCQSGPDQKPASDIDLSNARRLESEGKKLEAIVEYARLVDELNKSGRTDARAHAAWGRILQTLHRLKFEEILARATAETRKRCASLEPWMSTGGHLFLSAGAAGRWNQVLSLGADQPLLAEAAGAIAGLLAEKVDDRPLRRGRLDPEGDESERLYRLALAQAASDYALYALGRATNRTPESVTGTAGLLRRLGREFRELSARPGVRPESAARWAEKAAAADASAMSLERLPAGEAVPLSNDLRQAVELDTNGLLRAATESNNKANDLLSRRATDEEILDALERALRHFAAARESLVEPSAVQKRTLDVMSIAADALRSLAFED